MRRSSSKNESNNKKFFLFVGVGVLMLLIGIAAVFGYNHWQKEQRKDRVHATSELFTEALGVQDYQKLTNLISETSLNESGYNQAEVQERYETIYGGLGVADLTVENIEVHEVEETEEFELSYDVAMETSLGILETQSYHTTFHEDEGEFTVDWSPALIFSEMEPNDTVQLYMQQGERGSIFDRNGELLAGKAPAWSAGLYPAMLGEDAERAENLETIAETFDTSVAQLENLLAASWVTAETFVPFTIVDEDRRPEMQGVVYQETTARAYPLGEAGAHLIGYTGEVSAEDIEEDPTLQPGDLIGKSGLEAAFDSRLRGKKGGTIQILTSSGDVKMTLQEAPVENGEDITLTIDRSMQQEYYNHLDGQSGAAVVTEPTSGELLVLTSSPSYDPTLMARGISTEQYQAYVENAESPFLSRYTARYAPGSTFKAITGAIGLDEGVTTLEKRHSIQGYQWQKDDTWGNFVVTRVSDQPTEVNLEDALVYSDNIFFAREALEMGAETYMNGLLQFPFGETFDLPFYMEPAQVSNSNSLNNEMILSDTAYGQGELLISPIQQAIFFSPFANEGELVYPVLELNQEDPEVSQPVTSESANIITELLIQVAESPNGTAHLLHDSPLTLAAKTGTTEVQSAENEGENNSDGFLLVFDADAHTFLSIILIEDSTGSQVVEQFAPLLEQH